LQDQRACKPFTWLHCQAACSRTCLAAAGSAAQPPAASASATAAARSTAPAFVRSTARRRTRRSSDVRPRGYRCPVAAERFIIGRSRNNVTAIGDTNVSRQHALVGVQRLLSSYMQ
jgi:hypothetical protein